MTFRNLMISALLLGLAGCGCNDDSTPPGSFNPAVVPAVLGIKTQAPPIPVQPPALGAMRIDVAILMDDGDSMNQTHLGIIPANAPDDKRERAQAARAIAETLEAQLRARLEAEYVAEGLPIPELDFAFAVARYEDFGGPFTNPNRRAGPVDDPTNPENDMDARPFILNMPILRQSHPEFAARFKTALDRVAPGDGNPRFVDPANGNKFEVEDPQTGLEALYQMAAPQNQDGTYGGWDGNGNGSTTDSGAPTSQDAARNPQMLPGDSGDVPAIGFELSPTLDPDDQPVYLVKDEAGNAVLIPNADIGGVPAQVPSLSSGNIGGMGWREDSARFVIVFGDIATVAPTDGPLFGTPELPGLLPPPLQTDMVTSTDGNVPPPDAPRQARSTLLGAFDGGAQFLQTGLQLTQRRMGEANGPVHDGGNGVAPVGAHTVQATIDRLNALDIEVLCLGTPFQGGLDTKPGETGVNGDIDSDISAVLFDPSDPNVVQPDPAPWFWMNAVNRLTTPEITSIAVGGGEGLFRAVYNLGTIWPFDPADPNGLDKSNVRNTVTDDLIERIRNWADVLDLGTLEESDLIQVQPLEQGSAQTHFTQLVQIPTYWADEARPADIEVVFPLAGQNPITYATVDDEVPLPASESIPFTVLANLDNIGNALPENATQVQEIEAYIVARGNGTDVDAQGNPIPLASATDTITQAEAAFTATVRDSRFPGPSAQLATVAVGCAILNDLAPGQDSSDQVGGTCPFPPAPPSTP